MIISSLILFSFRRRANTRSCHRVSTRCKIRRKILKEWKLDKCNFISHKNSQCFIASNTKIIIITFRGTELDEVEDIISDVNVEQIKKHGGRVHKGFFQAYGHVKNRLITQLRRHRDNNQATFITGHSLGGALAVIAANDLAEKKFPVKSIYTFGQPRVGDKDYSKNYEKIYGKKIFA